MAGKRKKKVVLTHKLVLIFGIFIMLASVLLLRFSRNLIAPCANSLSCEESLSLNIENNAVGIYNNQQVYAPDIDVSQDNKKSKVLGTDNSESEKHIYVDLATQTLYAYQGDILFMKTLISSGLWGRTPTGEFKIWTKIRATRMSGGSGADYYNLPNVPYVMFFSNNEVAASRGFSLHGTYWHNNFGHPMSHGCVNMKTTDIAKLYEWADDNPGTKITIFDSSRK